ncbi:hypothetical protein BABINDRAFT_163804 [Babjeviella inositovora NRRL Y-12698]|uniref:RRM domain-containing protein n=1 Tax=Babjeviella inositovora NRRL Y-12698 TaxID=984486 RepID=A0A1E3QHA5_9ASCO|nr:uncharacterized protein BABINDRAFT_163804 [Babjeviella inositovora NRRL Y-12698]ODQ77071.1 hypothetical protein BABINDRAFT_163804 [Babjeviella inositovora NRRL Y-12698]
MPLEDEDAFFDDIYGSDDESAVKKEEPIATAGKKEAKKPEATEELDSKESSDAVKPEASVDSPPHTEETSVSSTRNDQTESAYKPAETEHQDRPYAPELKPQSVSGYQSQQYQRQQQGYQNTPPPPPAGPTKTLQSDDLAERSEYYNRDQGKMFIGGLNWDTTEEGLRDYFSKYGEIVDFTIMKDNNTGKSRGFGFLTFRDGRSVDEVLKTLHTVDGKMIDPKRAIPREEQDKTGKIFIGGIGPDVNEQDFSEFFGTFGNIIDAQLMIDKATGRTRGFGFVTYDSPEAVERVTQNKYLTLKGKAMEVKKAEPRGGMGQNNHGHQQRQFNNHQHNNHGQNNNHGYGNNYNAGGYNNNYQQQQYGAMAGGNTGAATGAASAAGNTAGMSPEMVSQYWQQMQQYWMQMQQMQQANPAQYQQMLAAQQPAQVGGYYDASTTGYDNGSGEAPPPPPPNPQQRSIVEDSNEGDSSSGYGKGRAPPNAPRGPRSGGAIRGRGHRGGYHPYGRN